MNKFYDLLEQLVEEAHGKDIGLPDVLKNGMITDLAIELEQRLFSTVADQLSHVDRLRLQSALVPPADFRLVEQIMQQNIPDYTTVLRDVFMQFRSEYLRICQK
ncbi:MAG: hypothetical protein HY565_00515 [Candidatus Kerfeldbacteria bacterium]|nr:hypothetical protein [Candidatus Kerfeldbacteria bacterium]